MGESASQRKVTLKGTTLVEAETNEGGKFEFLDVQPGTTLLSRGTGMQLLRS